MDCVGGLMSRSGFPDLFEVYCFWQEKNQARSRHGASVEQVYNQFGAVTFDTDDCHDDSE